MAKKASRNRVSEVDAPSRPLWVWILLFLLPLLASELMFYIAGRGLSMILFAIAWIGFWAAMLHRSGWAILKREKGQEKEHRSKRR